MTIFSTILARCKQLGLTESVTWKKRVVGDTLDPDTGEPEVTWGGAGNEETIDVVIQSVTPTEFLADLKDAEETFMIQTASAIKHLDHIVRVDSTVYEVLPVKAYSQAGYYVASMKRLVIE